MAQLGRVWGALRLARSCAEAADTRPEESPKGLRPQLALSSLGLGDLFRAEAEQS